MTLSELQIQVRQVVRDPTVESSITTWANDAILELAGEYELPALRLRTPATLTTTASDWLYDIAEASHDLGYEYLKRVWRVSSSTVPQGFIIENDMTAFYDLDPERDDTGTAVQRVAIDGDQLGVYPLCADSLSLWYFRKPGVMEDDDDEPDGIPAPYHYRVLVPKIVLRAMRLYPELISDNPSDNTRALTLWQTRLQSGLYGDGFEIGMLSYLSKANRPYGIQVRGPRLGSNVGGGGFYVRRAW